MTLVTITTRESDRQAGKREIANLQKVTGQVSFFMSCRRTKIYLRTDSVVVEEMRYDQLLRGKRGKNILKVRKSRGMTCVKRLCIYY